MSLPLTVCSEKSINVFVPVLAKYENQINVFSEFLEDLPDTEELVWILGHSYNVKTGNNTHLSWTYDIHKKPFCSLYDLQER